MMTVIFKGTNLTRTRGKQLPFLIFLPCTIFFQRTMYPTPQELAIIHEAENLMIETMAKYDPSHDQYHGESGTWTSAIEKSTDVSIQLSASAKQL
jgi:hypothetical protein